MRVHPAIGEAALCDAQLLRAGQRATQTVAPATRREVVRRDAGSCAVPGCRHGAFVEVHHDATLRLVPPVAYVRHASDGAVEPPVDGEGGPPRLAHMRHEEVGGVGSPVPTVLMEQVVGLLTAMGYRKRESRSLVEAAIAGSELPTDRTPATEELLRTALRSAKLPGYRCGGVRRRDR